MTKQRKQPANRRAEQTALAKERKTQIQRMEVVLDSVAVIGSDHNRIAI